MSDDNRSETGTPHWKDTVTVTFIANFEVDPNDFDLRLRDPEKVRQEIFDAVVPGTGSLQELCGNSDEGVERQRKRIAEAKRRDSQ